MIQIKRRGTLEVIFEADVDTIKEALEKAVASCANLFGADLSGANLSEANLSGANLYRADLSCADLSCANLSCTNLSHADLSGTNLSRANLSRANLSDVDLSEVNLSGADLSGANLFGADLSCTNLSHADLSGTNLFGADLSEAKGIIQQQYTPLMLLFEQSSTIRAYKLTKADGTGPYNDGIIYSVGKTYEVNDANTDPFEHCAAGINVATLDWCLREWRTGYRIFVVEFTKEDIAAIPNGTDGKFRLKKCKVVREMDLKAELSWPLEECK